SSVVPIAGQPIAENRAYLPSIAISAMLVFGVLALGRRSSVIALTCVVPASLFLTWQRNSDFRSNLALWSDTAMKCPDSHRAQGSLGMVLIELPGRFNEGLQHLERARQQAPWDAQVFYDLGKACLHIPNR